MAAPKTPEDWQREFARLMLNAGERATSLMSPGHAAAALMTAAIGLLLRSTPPEQVAAMLHAAAVDVAGGGDGSALH